MPGSISQDMQLVHVKSYLSDFISIKTRYEILIPKPRYSVCNAHLLKIENLIYTCPEIHQALRIVICHQAQGKHQDADY